MSTFRLPDLGEGLAEAEIVEWHVKVGDHVRVDQPMVSVETAKAVVEVPAPFSGIVTALRGAPGDIVPTGAPLIEFDSGTVVGSMPATSEEEFVESVTVGGEHRHGSVARGRAVPAARALAKRLGVDLAAVQGGGRAGLITLDDVLRHANIPAAANGARGSNGALDSNASPDSNGDLGSNGAPVSNGTFGSNGAPVSPAARAIAAAGPGDGTVEPLRGVRRAMAQSMSLSRDQVAGSTVCDDADIHCWTQRGDYMLRLMRAMICAWRVEPALNAWYDSATQSRFLVAHIDLGVAVDTPGGLIVPVVRNIENKSPEELRAAIALQKEAAHRRSTPAEDLRDFTLMLSNFGTLAGRYGIPRVVPPAVAILGAGKVREDAVVVGGLVHAHRRMPLSLSFDHRCITGGEACRFLASVITDLEKPD
jgi:2-oxoisovalerate dehydrogenase E2 component (dihydrolipoyl transacylase)